MELELHTTSDQTLLCSMSYKLATVSGSNSSGHLGYMNPAHAKEVAEMSAEDLKGLVRMIKDQPVLGVGVYEPLCHA